MSNRESGNGRPDVIIIPEDKSKKGIVIEFKVAEKESAESLQSAVKTALNQIDDRNYTNELKLSKIKEAIKMGIAFYGKEVSIGYEEVYI